jgi:uncharacterized protein YggE
MRRVLLLLLLLACLLPLRLHAQAAAPVPQVVVVGRAEVAVTADEATVLIAVESRQVSAAAAGAENAQRMRAVRDAVIRAGIPADSITSSAYSVQPYLTMEDGRTRQQGYVARNAVRVRTHRLELVGRIIDSALAAGADRVDAVQFEASSTAEARRAALAQAVANARADAEAMARAAGASLGNLLELTTIATPSSAAATAIRIRGANAETNINATDVLVEATVTARWRLISN